VTDGAAVVECAGVSDADRIASLERQVNRYRRKAAKANSRADHLFREYKATGARLATLTRTVQSITGQLAYLADYWTGNTTR
jgi:hypothetical protein